MKRTSSNFLLILLLFFTGSFAFSANTIDMKLYLLKGANYTYSITQENKVLDERKSVQAEQSMTLKINHKVIDRQNNGNYVIEASYLSFNFDFKYNGKLIHYNSDTIDVKNPLYKQLNFLTSVKLSYEVSPEGTVSKITGFDLITKKMDEDPMLFNLFRALGNEQVITELYNHIPYGGAAVGGKWTKSGELPDLMNLKYDIQYKLKEATEQNLTIEREATFKDSRDLPKAPNGNVSKIDEKGNQTGTLVIDAKTNMRISSVVNQVLDVVTTTIPDKSTDKIITPVQVNTRTTITRIKK